MQGLCRAKAADMQTEFPVKKQKPPKKEQRLFVFLIETPNGICVRKRTKGVLKDSYEFPSVEAEDGLTVEKALEVLGVSAFTLCKEGAYTHVFTHIRWEMAVHHVRTKEQPFTAYPLAEIEERISLPTAFRQCLSLLT